MDNSSRMRRGERIGDGNRDAKQFARAHASAGMS